MTQRGEFQVNIVQRNRETHVTISGEIDLRTSPGLRKQLLDLLGAQAGRFVLDLSRTAYMDSSGLGTLVELKRQVDRRGGSLVLVAPQPRVRSLFEITRLDGFFEIRASVDVEEGGAEPA